MITFPPELMVKSWKADRKKSFPLVQNTGISKYLELILRKHNDFFGKYGDKDAIGYTTEDFFKENFEKDLNSCLETILKFLMYINTLAKNKKRLLAPGFKDYCIHMNAVATLYRRDIQRFETEAVGMANKTAAKVTVAKPHVDEFTKKYEPCRKDCVELLLAIKNIHDTGNDMRFDKLQSAAIQYLLTANSIAEFIFEQKYPDVEKYVKKVIAKDIVSFRTAYVGPIKLALEHLQEEAKSTAIIKLEKGQTLSKEDDKYILWAAISCQEKFEKEKTVIQILPECLSKIAGFVNTLKKK